MKEAPRNLNQKIAQRIHDMRLAKNLSLEKIAEKSGVSRSMISLIERGESSPTAVVLDKIAAALGVALASLFADAEESAQVSHSPLIRHAEQPVWQDPASGYVRRNVSPNLPQLPFQIVEVQFPPGKRVTFEGVFREAALDEQVWIIEGVIEVTLGSKKYRLQQGDCLAVHLDGPITYHNPTRKASRYAVVIANNAADGNRHDVAARKSRVR